MNTRKKVLSEEIESRLIADAHTADAWEHVARVPASRSPRPVWYGLKTLRAQKSASRTAQVVDISEARAKRRARVKPTVSDSGTDAVLRKQLHDAIAELAEGQRQSVQLWLDGFSYSEIATALRISADAVKSRLREAKRHLRSRLDEPYVADGPRATKTRNA